MLTNYSSKQFFSLIVNPFFCSSYSCYGHQNLETDYNNFQRILYKQMPQPDNGCTEEDCRREKETNKNKKTEKDWNVL